MKRGLTESEIQNCLDQCIQIRKNAYAKYSGFSVGALVIDELGREFAGVNVENASYGLTVCAERNAISAAVAGGMKRIRVLCALADTPVPVVPCGACRQVIAEFSDKDTILILANTKRDYKILSPEDLMPLPFVLGSETAG